MIKIIKYSDNITILIMVNGEWVTESITPVRDGRVTASIIDRINILIMMGYKIVAA